MLKNYFISNIRSILQNRLQTFLNLAGLSIGIASFLIIYRYVSNEENFDGHHIESDRVYRVLTHIEMQSQKDRAGQNGFAVGPLLQQSYPQLETYTRVFGLNKQSVWFEDKMFAEETVAYADSTLFDIFNYNLLEGDKSALKHPNAIVISEEMAIKYFGSVKSALGKELKFTTFSTNVSGVFRKTGNTHLFYQFYISIATLPQKWVDERNKDYMWLTGFLYIKLKPGVTPAEFSTQLGSFYERVIDPYCKANNIGSLRYELQPIKTIHLDNKTVFDMAGHSNPAYIRIFRLVGFFILFIAGVNYMNLTTARSTKRTMEVGIRKVVGALRGQLIWQFMLESLIMTMGAIIISVLIIQVSLSAFNDLTQQQFVLSDFLQLEFLLKVASIIFTVAILSGIYPSIYLSGFRPSEILKLKKSGKVVGRGFWFSLVSPVNLRKGLVLLQFSISIMLIVGTLVVSSQLKFLQKKDMGFTKEQIFVIDIPNDTTVSTRLDVIKTELTKNTRIKSVATGSGVPGTKFAKLTFNVDQGEGAVVKLINYGLIDQDYLKTLDVQVVEGRNFDRDITSDETEGYLINEAAVKFIGAKQAIGAKLENGFGTKGFVVGVMKNFNFTSLHSPLEPLVFMYTRKTAGFLMIKMEPGDVNNTLKYIERTWKEFDPNHPYETFFLDDNFNKTYDKENRLLFIFVFFAILSIFISCLGVLGLSLFASEARIKEIGIRKVMGATTFNISGLLVKDFIVLVVLANLIAWPLAFFYLKDWLGQFAYRIDITWAPFVLASAIALTIALTTMLYTIAKSVSGSMVKALKYE